MRGYTLIVVFNQTADQVLMCRRRKNPYQGLFNFVGGKIEEGESPLDAAYRELEEETSLTKSEIMLSHLIGFSYPLDHLYMEVYVGKMQREKAVHGDENELFWFGLEENFFDTRKFAGEGNIGHIMMHIKRHKKELTP